MITITMKKFVVSLWFSACALSGLEKENLTFKGMLSEIQKDKRQA